VKDSATEIVERYLRSQHASNTQRQIWPSNNVVIDRLLQDGANLGAAWRELLSLYPCGNTATGTICEKWQMVVDAIVEVAAGWSPERVSITRQAVRDVSDLTREIKNIALELAELMRRRSRVCEANTISKTPMDFHPIDLLAPAARIADRHAPQRHAETHYRFMNYIDRPLGNLSDQFDLKYWPRTADLVEAIAEAQDDARFSVDGTTEAAISVRQASTRDFNRALGKALTDLSYFGIEISFSHASYAAIANAACGLDQTESASNVKAYRSNMRKRAGNNSI
jgi:hypothetical protein